MKLHLSKEDLQAFLIEQFHHDTEAYIVDSVGDMQATLRLQVAQKHLRPGGTVSGPTIFGLADVAMYITILGMIGPVALAVTTSCSIDFMRKAAANTDLIARTRLLKLGRTLAVGDVLVYSQGQDAPVARASLTYSIPPKA